MHLLLEFQNVSQIEFDRRVVEFVVRTDQVFLTVDAPAFRGLFDGLTPALNIMHGTKLLSDITSLYDEKMIQMKNLIKVNI